jgi:hypothetical protein
MGSPYRVMVCVKKIGGCAMDYKLGDCFTIERFTYPMWGMYTRTKLNANTIITIPQRGISKSSRYW